MKKLLLYFFVSALLLGCSKDDPEITDGGIHFVTAVNAPETAKINETIEIEVDFKVYNGCGKFGRFVESGNGFSRDIEVHAKYEGEVCTQNIPTITAIYEFTPEVAGDYELRFFSLETELTTVNITVTE